MRVRDLDPNRTVYVTSTRPKRVHLIKSCHQIPRKVYSKRARVLDSSKPVCKDCCDPNYRSDLMSNVEQSDFASMLDNADPDDFSF